MFTHSATGVGCQELQRSGIGSGSSDDDRVLHGIRVRQTLDNLSDGGSLLTDGNVDAVQFLLLISAIVETFLVYDGINGNGGLTVKLFNSIISSLRERFCMKIKFHCLNYNYSFSTRNHD